jgi:hypothetical protein
VLAGRVSGSLSIALAPLSNIRPGFDLAAPLPWASLVAMEITPNPGDDLRGLPCDTDTGSGGANSTSELGQDADGFAKRNRGTAEATIRHEKIEV